MNNSKPPLTIAERAVKLFGRDDELAQAFARFVNERDIVGSTIGTLDDYARAREMAPWATADLWRRGGFSVTPIRPTGKRPFKSEWQRGSIAPQPIDHRLDPACSIGLVCGYGGLFAIDVDRAEALPAIEAFFAERGIAPGRKWSRPDSVTLIVYISGVNSAPSLAIPWGGVTDEKHAGIDLLGSGKQTVVYGVHPAGRLFQCDIEPENPEVPTISLADLLALVERCIEIQQTDRARVLGSLAGWWIGADLPLPDALAEVQPVIESSAESRGGYGIEKSLNDAAMGALGVWVPALFGNNAHAVGSDWRARAVWRGGSSDNAVSISAKHGIKDHGGRGYSAIGLVREMQGGTRREARKWLADTLGMVEVVEAAIKEPVDAEKARQAAVSAHNADGPDPIGAGVQFYYFGGGRGDPIEVRQAVEMELAGLGDRFGERNAPHREGIVVPLAPREGEPSWPRPTLSLQEGRAKLSSLMGRIRREIIVAHGRGATGPDARAVEVPEPPVMPEPNQFIYDGMMDPEKKDAHWQEYLDRLEDYLALVRYRAAIIKRNKAALYASTIHCIEATTGLGKTHAIRKLFPQLLSDAERIGVEKPVLFYLVPFLKLGDEFSAAYGDGTLIWRGRKAKDSDGEPMCKAPWRIDTVTARPRTARRYTESKDLGVSATSDPERFHELRAKRNVGVYTEPGADEPTAHRIEAPDASRLASVHRNACAKCPFREGCRYLGQFEGVKDARIVVGAHDMLTTGLPVISGANPVAVVVDETPTRLLSRDIAISDADVQDGDAAMVPEEDRPELLKALGAARKLLGPLSAATGKWQRLGARLTQADVAAAFELPADRSFAKIENKLALDRYGVPVRSAVLPVVEAARFAAGVVAKAIDRGAGETLEPGATEESVKDTLARLKRLRNIHELLEAVQDAERIEVARADGAGWMIRTQPQTNEMFQGVPTILLDGTSPPVEVLSRRWPTVKMHEPIRVRDHDSARRVLVIAPESTSGKLEAIQKREDDAKKVASAVTDGSAEPNKPRRPTTVEQIVKALRQLAGGKERSLVIAPLKAKEALGADATYGSLRGLDRFNGVPVTGVVGRPAPYSAVVAVAEFLAGRDFERESWFPKENVAVPLQDGRVVDVEVITHHDPAVRAALSMVVSDELRQADARARPASNPVAIVHVLPDVVPPALIYDAVVQIEDVELFGVDLGAGCLVPTRAGLGWTKRESEQVAGVRHDIEPEEIGRRVRWWLDALNIPYRVVRGALPRGKVVEALAWVDEPVWPEGWVQLGGPLQVGDKAAVARMPQPAAIQLNTYKKDDGRLRHPRLTQKHATATLSFGRVIPISGTLLAEAYPETWLTTKAARVWFDRNRTAVTARMESLVAAGFASRVTINPGRSGMKPVAGYLNHCAPIAPAIEFPMTIEPNEVRIMNHTVKAATTEEAETAVSRIERRHGLNALRATCIPEMVAIADALEAGLPDDKFLAMVAGFGPCNVGLEVA